MYSAVFEMWAVSERDFNADAAHILKTALYVRTYLVRRY